MKKHKQNNDKKIKTKVKEAYKNNSNSSNNENSDSEHELIYYEGDRVKLMQKVLKTIKSKKIKAMAPNCIRDLDVDEINSMLLEELLGISKKRLMLIFAGKNLTNESSSSDSDEDKLDVISLDDITTDEDIVLLNAEEEASGHGKKRKMIKKEPNIKQETVTTSKTDEEADVDGDEDRVMSVLELLELQARARAIRSQLALEKAEKKKKKKLEAANSVKVKSEHGENNEDSDSVIIESPKHVAIVIASDSEEERSMGIDDTGKDSSSIQETLSRENVEIESLSCDTEGQLAGIVNNVVNELPEKCSTPTSCSELNKNPTEVDEEIIFNITDQDDIEEL